VLALPVIGRELGLILTFLLVTWQAMGGGLTGTAWQSMIGKIMPADWRGTFYGAQSAAANLLGSVGAVVAAKILSDIAAPNSFALCFVIAGIAMMLSWSFLNSTREPEAAPARETSRTAREFWRGIRTILRGDHNLRLFIFARITAQIASVGFAFFTVYAVNVYGMDVGTAGIMTGVLMLTQTIANPIVGWLGDRTSHRVIFALGALLAGGSAAVAMLAPSAGWFYVVFALSGAAGAALWTTVNALTYEFGPPEDRPYYIGLINTMVAPAALLAPLIGGWLADNVGYSSTFTIALVSGVITALLMISVREPRQHYAVATAAAAHAVE
jgi:MFS family permease